MLARYGAIWSSPPAPPPSPVLRCRSRSSTAWDRRSYSEIPALRRFAWALLRDGTVADDLVQDCLERAIAGWHLRHHDGNLKAWLFAILHNLFLSNRRRSARGGMDRSLDDDGAAALMRADSPPKADWSGRMPSPRSRHCRRTSGQ